MQERIKFIRKTHKLNQAEFGSRIGVSQPAVAGYESGIRVPIDAIILSICKEFDVNEDWLRTGSGEPFVEKSEDDELTEWVSRVLDGRSDDIKLRMLKLLKKLSDTEWEALDGILAKWHEMDEQ